MKDGYYLRGTVRNTPRAVGDTGLVIGRLDYGGRENPDIKAFGTKDKTTSDAGAALLALKPGSPVMLRGKVSEHPEHGTQFVVYEVAAG